MLAILSQIILAEKYLATESVSDWDLQSVYDLTKRFVSTRVAHIDNNFFRCEFYKESGDLILVFVKYDVIVTGKKQTVDSEVVYKKIAKNDGKKLLAILFFGERTQFLEYSEKYGYGFDQVEELYRVPDTQ